MFHLQNVQETTSSVENAFEVTSEEMICKILFVYLIDSFLVSILQAGIYIRAEFYFSCTRHNLQ